MAQLWDLADSGADADAVLDALLAGGLSSLDHFALVAQGDESTRSSFAVPQRGRLLRLR